MNQYGRADVLRILRISANQLLGWQRAGLVATSNHFSFSDLVQLRTIRDLRAKRVRPAVIRQSLMAMQKQVAGMENPLIEASAFSIGSHVAYRHEGHSFDPVTGQLVLEFEPVGAMLSARPTSEKIKPIATCATTAELFARGVAMEEHPSTHDEAIRSYQQVLEIEPGHAAAHINLGTLYYNRRDFISAEKHYRLAVEADRRYALAYFDLGNVLDETGRVEEAAETYRTALQLAPTYADAHYNLALAYERLGQPRRALHHWRAYLKLDGTGAWARHARSQVSKILAIDPLKVVYRRGD
ncbi:MAG TPA: tetratricopeptide repeat protein [Terriglobales bacterium]|nr:tetratricopeptide repeat protein [Terriglobales bacterium]